MRVETVHPAFVLALRKDSPAPASPAEQAVSTDVVVDIGVASRPPAEVLAAVKRAAQVASELHMQNRELHFSKDQASGRIIVQVRDLRGNVIRTIPPSTALETLAPGAWR